MKKFKVWLKENVLILILEILFWAVFILEVALQIPEWAKIVIGCVELILLSILLSYSFWHYKMKSQKKEDEKEVEDEENS